MNKISFTCSKPLFDDNGNLSYVKTIPYGFVTRTDANGKEVVKRKNGQKMVKYLNVPAKRGEFGARLSKDSPTHVLGFEFKSNILFCAYGANIQSPSKKMYDTFSKKEGKKVVNEKLKVVAKGYLEGVTAYQDLEEVLTSLPFKVADTFEHYLGLALSSLNIHGRVALMLQGDSRVENEIIQLEFEACDDTCTTCENGKTVDLGCSKTDTEVVEEFEDAEEVEEFVDEPDGPLEEDEVDAIEEEAEDEAEYIFAIATRAKDEAMAVIFQNKVDFEEGYEDKLSEAMYEALGSLASEIGGDQEVEDQCILYLYKDSETTLEQVVKLCLDAGLEESDKLGAKLMELIQ